MKNINSILVLILLTSQVLAQANIQSDIEQLIQAAADLERFSGVVHVQKGEKVLLHAAYGISDIQQKLRNTTETAFDIGSVSKQFTATAILKLKQEGKLKLHHPINQYLGAFGSKKWEKVTIHHLLSHQSGIPSIMQGNQGLDNYWPEERPIEWKEQISYLKDLKLLEKPGSHYRYNNTGYLLLALIVEKVSGMQFKAYMESEIFQPNELCSTSVGPSLTNKSAKNHYGYAQKDMKLAPAYHHSWYQGAGGNYSTLHDLNHWYEVLNHSTLLNDENRSLMFTPQAQKYGYGWVITQRDQQKIIYHDGTNFGATCFFLTAPEEDIRIILLTNQTHEALEKLGQSEQWIKDIGFKVLDILNGESIEPLPLRLKSIPASYSIQPHLGTYQFDNGYTLSLEGNQKEILLQTQDQSYPVFRHFFHQPLSTSVHSLVPKAIGASTALAKPRFWQFAKFCNGEMKFVCYSGLMAIGYKSLVKQLGGIKKTIVYEVREGQAKARFYGIDGNIDFAFVFDENDKIQGIFDIGYSKALEQKVTKLIPLEGQSFLADGFSIGEIDAIISFREFNGKHQLVMTQKARTFLATKLD